MVTKRPPASPSLLATTFLLMPTLAAFAPLVRADGLHPGEVIFREQCEVCHGVDGQGEEGGYEQPLAGELTIGDLARRIEETMPEGEPELCVGQQARDVASYIHGEFYSPEAQLRKGLVEPPRVELVRLTAPQYRSVVADVMAQAMAPERRRRRSRSDRDKDESAAEPGLRAEYYQSEGMSKADKLVLKRVDPSVAFDFETESPAEGITADQFAIIWQGSLLTAETGFYEFRLRTQNGARLYINQQETEQRSRLRDDSGADGLSAFIDAWVGSGEMREVEGRVFLLGGRTYPLRLEFFKYLEVTASIVLEWKPPHGTWSTLDGRNLTTDGSLRSYVVDTPFPADDRSLGYERGSGISRQWHEAATNAAIAAADEVVRRMARIADVDAEDGGRGDLQDFIARLASIAFRRPLSDEERQFYRETPFADAPDLETALRRAVLLVMQSPYFVYVDLMPSPWAESQHAVAARLALSLWDSIPDAELRRAAEEGRLASTEQIETQARRMLADPRARHKMRGFFRHWLELEERDLSKDKAMFPNFDEQVVADLRHSLEEFVEQVLWSDASDYRELLLADYLLLNDRLCELYLAAVVDGDNDPRQVETGDAKDEPADESPEAAFARTAPTEHFAAVHFPPERRAGVLTHPYLLSAFAYHNNTSPIHRGVFLTRNIVGRGLKPPPIAVAFKDDEFPTDLTMREKITLLTRDTACMSCHSVINPLGFALENFDAVGRWRNRDNEKPIDTRGQYTDLDGTTIDVDRARDIAQFAAASDSAHEAFVKQVFLHLVKQSPWAYGPDVVDRLREQFVDDQFNMQNLIVRVATAAAMRGLPHEVQSP